ncbi:hypothetical protein ABW19_dt0202901 [Dactylella cylindrospora]|nr:hypothetical protein ABW19_dt0202901 [Dactylella cylindrospora]
MSAKDTPSKAQLITPGQTTPTYTDGGWFSIKAAPVTINGTKDQIIRTLLHFNAYHAWNNFIPAVSDINHPTYVSPSGQSAAGTENADSNEEPPAKPSDLGEVGTVFTFHARMFSSLPFLKFKSTEKVTVIDRENGVVAWMAVATPGERVHIIKEDEYGACKYECYETFRFETKTFFVRWLFGWALRMRFDEWGEDLKKAVEGQNW